MKSKLSIFIKFALNNKNYWLTPAILILLFFALIDSIFILKGIKNLLGDINPFVYKIF